MDHHGTATELRRRDFLAILGGATLGRLGLTPSGETAAAMPISTRDSKSAAGDSITLFLAGDVMLGRGIDQILPHPSDPRLYEPSMTSAEEYVELAEKANGPIPRPVDFSYVWGNALAVLRRERPDVRLTNLETSITKAVRYEPKGINYRMNPDNVAALVAASIDCCALANNHALDWGRPGLLETLDTLGKAGIRAVGAGRNTAQAGAPAVLDVVGKGRVVVFSFGSTTSGIPAEWAAGESEPGVNLLEDLSARTVARIARQTGAVKASGDVLVASIHWGSNWGYQIPGSHRRFAHGLIDSAGFDIVFGHSSHHPKGIEVYRNKLILYGCGDFLNDYEGIGGYEEFRDDLVLMYLPIHSVSNGELLELKLIPFQIKKFRLNRVSRQDAVWLRDILGRESAEFGIRVSLNEDSTLTVLWQ